MLDRVSERVGCPPKGPRGLGGVPDPPLPGGYPRGAPDPPDLGEGGDDCLCDVVALAKKTEF